MRYDKENTMEFHEFYRVGKGVFYPKDVPKSTILSSITKRFKKLPWNVSQVLALKQCHRELFPFSEKVLETCVNDTLLDLEPITDASVENLLLVERKGNVFCFSLEEILSIFHSDLSRSVVEYEPHYHITTLTKAFRLPTHPYLQEKFTVDEIRQIVEQIVLKFDSFPAVYPEVFLFLRHATTLLETCADKSNYETTTCLEAFFEAHKARFMEKYTVKTRENQSYWNVCLPQFPRTDSGRYLWFVENIFCESFENSDKK